MSSSQFVHLRVHTEFSLVDGLVRIEPLMQHVLDHGMHAVAITDFCNLFAVIKVFQAAVAKGIKPIFGADLPCVDSKNAAQGGSIVLLCQNETGYRNLTRLVSKAYLEGQWQGQPRIFYEWLDAHASGLIALSGGRTGDIGQALLADDEPRARAHAHRWMKLFPKRFYLEIQRTGRSDEALYNARVVRLADELGLPLVATNDVCFLKPEEFDAHEARVCIHDGDTLADPKRVHRYSQEQYLRTPQEMDLLFPDLPDAIQNTVEISKRCTVKLELGQNYLPNFPSPEGSTVEIYLSQLAEQGLTQRLQVIAKAHPNELLETLKLPYDARLKTELAVINSMGFSSYFLIVADFIKWAKENGVPVGPGRGSGAGSLVAYALNITDLDPLQYELLFERFLNPERISMPDFDIDFCMEGRDRVIEYVALRYGRQNVSQIITFGTMAAKAVIRDVGRVLGHPYGFVDKLAKLIPFEIGMTLTKALEQEEELRRRYQDEEDVSELINLALTLEGITRNAGKHAGGVVIAPTALTDFTAVYCEEGSTQWVSQFDKDDVEAVGLVKFDFLGLRTLTIIDWALKIVNEENGRLGRELVDIHTLSMADLPTFALIKACQTTAVFQVESRGMKELIHRLQPDCFEEIIALVALFRPGPLQSGMVDDFIDRKHGRAPVVYPHPDLEPILKPTYGVILYQEQVMQIAQVLANYTLGAADLLRRAMGKKKPEEMASQRAIFTEGAMARGVSLETATTIFDLMEKFAGYGFNKSHSAAYALLAYQTAWLKAHYPAAFMAAVISSDMDNTDKVVTLIQECKRMGLVVLPPAIQHAHYRFTVRDEGTIVYGFGAIKGLGEAAIESLIDVRKHQGVGEGLFDFCRRMDLRRVNRRVLDALIKSGSMDEWGVDRALLNESIGKALQQGLQFHQNQGNRQTNLFDELDDSNEAGLLLACKPWSMKQRLAGEKETLGFYLSGHPADPYQQELGRLVTSMTLLGRHSPKKVMVCGLVQGVRRIMTKRGKRLAIVTLEDALGRVDVVVFSEVFDPQEKHVVPGEVLVVEGEVGQDDYTGGVKLTAIAIYTMMDARTHFSRYLSLTLNADDEPNLPALQTLLASAPGDCGVHIRYQNSHAVASMTVATQWHVAPHDALLEELNHLLNPARVELCY
jgi:DNA polymerase-3 subunit alpha